jgi:hypothetical protein
MLTTDSFYKHLKYVMDWAKIETASSPSGFLSKMIVLILLKVSISEEQILMILLESMNSQIQRMAFRLKSDPGALISLIAQSGARPCSTSVTNYFAEKHWNFSL